MSEFKILILYTNSLTGITWLVNPSPSTDQLSINLSFSLLSEYLV